MSNKKIAISGNWKKYSSSELNRQSKNEAKQLKDFAGLLENKSLLGFEVAEIFLINDSIEEKRSNTGKDSTKLGKHIIWSQKLN
jgi:hypothetical protein